jgi:TIR domain
MAHDVFISHSAKDKPVADAICAALEREGIRCWIAPRDILPGKPWGGAIVEGINDSKAMVLVYSSNANESRQILREVERAVNRGIPVIPFRIQDVTPSQDLEFYIMSQHWLDALTPPLETHIARLADTVKRLVPENEREARIKPGEAAPADTAGTASAEAVSSSRSKYLFVGFIAVVILAGLAGYIFSRPGDKDKAGKKVTKQEQTFGDQIRDEGNDQINSGDNYSPHEMYGILYNKCFTDALCVESSCRAYYPNAIKSETCVNEFWTTYAAENGAQIMNTFVSPDKVDSVYSKCGDDVICLMNECKNTRTSWTENFVCFTKVLERITHDRPAIERVALDGAILTRIKSECKVDSYLCVSRICKDTVGIHFTQFLACTERGLAAVR